MDKVLTEQPTGSILTNLKEITKMRLSVSVVFSSVAGYFLGVEVVDFLTVILLSVGGYLLVGASNSFNQIIERKRDRLMDRTKNRPLPTGRMSVTSAASIGFSFAVSGLAVLYSINPVSALFGAVSIVLYVLVYTPLKTKTPLSVFVGAFPGAIPFMLGWVAATNEFSIEPGTLFMMQFFWQFPHFWALGWWLYDDYKKGGFFMLPTGKRDRGTAIQIILYTIWTIVISIVPVFGLTGELKLSVVGAILISLLGLVMLYYAVKLYRERSVKIAKQLMFASVSYITLLQIIYVFDKYIRLWI